MISFENYTDHRISNTNVTVASWSPKVDILFIGSKKGDFYLYRLPITLIWKQLDRSEKSVASVAWHIDGFIFAVGYESGCIKLFPVQHNICIYTIKFPNPIIYLNWDEYRSSLKFKDDSDTFQNIENLYQNSLYQDEVKKFQEVLKLSTKLTILYGISGDKLFFLSNGLFLLGSIHLNSINISSNIVYDTILNSEFDHISLITNGEESDNEHQIMQHEFSCKFIKNNINSISLYTNKFIKILYLEMVVEIQIRELHENWDDFIGCFNKFLEEFAQLDVFGDEDYCLKSNVLEIVLFSDCQLEFWQGLHKLMSQPDTQQFMNKVNMIRQQPLDSFFFNLMLSLIQLSFYYNQLLNLTTSNLDSEYVLVSRADLLELTRISSLSILKVHELQKIMKKVNNDIFHFLSWFHFKAQLHSQNEDEVRTSMQKIAEMDEYIQHIVEFVTHGLEVVPSQLADNDISTGPTQYRVKMRQHYIETDTESSLPFITRCHDRSDLDSTIRTVIELANTTCNLPPGSIQSHYCINGWFNMDREMSLYQLFNGSYKLAMSEIVTRKIDSCINDFLIDEVIYTPKLLGSISLSSNTGGSSHKHAGRNVLLSRKCSLDGSSVSIAYFDSDKKSIEWMYSNNDVAESVSLVLDRIDEVQIVQRVIKMDFLTPHLLLCLLTTGSSELSSASCSTITNSYLTLVRWGDIPDVFKTSVQTNQTINIKDSLSYTQPFVSHYCQSGGHLPLVSDQVACNTVCLSAVPSAFRTEHLPRDAKSMILNYDRGILVVFFGKSYEKCRVFMLNSS